MQTFEYSLELSTGERLAVTEIAMGALDSWMTKAFSDAAARQLLAGVLDLCTRAPRCVLDDAKIGYTKPLERLLKTPPSGALMRLDKPECFSMSNCAVADKAKCTARFDKFPECWDYDIGHSDDFTDAMSAAQELAKTVVFAWKDGRYVIISE
jgi:hypothetical protein